MNAIESHLGWELLSHRTACKRPAWTVDVKTDDYGLRKVYEDEGRHSCSNESCEHESRFDETTVRIVCRSCGVAHEIAGELTGRTTTSTRALGYGLPPRKVAGLFLHPGEPFLAYGRAVSDEPHDFVVTRDKTERVTADNVFGTISQHRGKRGAVQWTALAVPDPDGQYGYGRPVRFAHAREAFRTVAAAAKWIAAQAEGGEQA